MGTVYSRDRWQGKILGLVLDCPPWEVPKYGFVVARNVRTQDKTIQTLGGKTLIAIAADGNPVSFIGLPTFFGGNQVGVVGTNQFLYQLANNALTKLNANAFTAAPGTPWEMAQLLDKAYFMNPSDPIQTLLDGAAVVAPLVAATGQLPRGYSMTDFYNHLIVANIVALGMQAATADARESFIGSGLGDDTFWNTGVLNKESRSFLIPLGNDNIQCIRKLGDYLVVYKTFSTHIVSYIGGDFVYSVEAIAARVGVVGTQVVVRVPAQNGANDQHYFIGQDEIYMFDGAAHPIGERIWDDFVTKVKPQTWTQIVGWYHEIAKEVYWGFASATGDGSIDTALVYDILDDCFYYRDWPFTAGGYMLNGVIGQDRWSDHPEDWNHILPAGRPWVTVSGLEDLAPFVGGKAGQVFQYESTPTSDFDTLVQTGLHDYGDSSRYKTVKGMRIDLSGVSPDPNKPAFELWGRGLDEISQYNTKPFQKLAVSRGNSLLNFQLSGRYIDFQFRQKAGGSFKLGDWEPYYKMRGER